MYGILSPDGVWRVFDLIGREGRQEMRDLPKQCGGVSNVVTSQLPLGQCPGIAQTQNHHQKPDLKEINQASRNSLRG